MKQRSITQENRIMFYLIAAISLVGMFGSLYFSEIAKLPPCSLCWYQRILMYPMVLLAPLGVLRRDRLFAWLILILAVLGLIVSGYHNLLQYDVIHENIIRCTNGVSCSNRQLNLFGFVTIPLLSLVAFGFITGLSARIVSKGE